MVIRHAEDHIHVAAMLVRQDTGHRVHPRNDYYLAVARHPDGLQEHRLALRSTADTLEVDGEIDMSNLYVLATALRALTDTPSPTVHIDLNAVTFLAAAAARTLIRDTAPYRDRGADVEIHATPPHHPDASVTDGTYVTTDTHLALATDLTRVRVAARIEEAVADDVGQVGQRVDIVVDAFPDTPLTGTVQEIQQDRGEA